MNRTGTIIGNELFVRCPFCGDSQTNLTKAHFSINTLKYIYNCFRCGISGKLSDAQMLSLIHSLPNMGFITKNIETHSRSVSEILEELDVGAGSSRKSNLSRWHFGEHDAFLSRSVAGDVVGVHIRAQDKSRIKSYGMLAFGYGEDALLSSPTKPLRIVEGAYDVLYPRDVCVFGTIHYGKLKALRGHYVILCPDGDVWERKELFREFNKTVKLLHMNYMQNGAIVIGVEYISEGRDPDEVPPEDRNYASLRQYLNTFN